MLSNCDVVRGKVSNIVVLVVVCVRKSAISLSEMSKFRNEAARTEIVVVVALLKINVSID